MSGNTIGIIIGLAVLIGGFIAYTIWQERKAKQDAANRPLENFTSVTIDWTHQNADGSPGSRNSVNNVTFKSPNLGIQFLSYCEIPMLEQLCAEQGVTESINDMPPGWLNSHDPKTHWIIVVPPDHVSEVDYGEGLGSPLLNVRQNMGTQDHPNISLISTAGTTIGLAVSGTSPMTGDVIGGIAMSPMAIVVPFDPAKANYPRMFRNAVRNETEHKCECENNAQVAQQYLFASDQHPHRGRDIWNDPLPEVPTV